MDPHVIKIAGTLLFGALSVWINYQFIVAKKKEPRTEGKDYCLRVSCLYLWAAALGFIMGLFFIVVQFFSGEHDLAAWVSSIFFLLLSIYLFMCFFNHRVRFNQRGFVVGTCWGKISSVEWGGICHLSYSYWLEYWVIKTENGGRYRIQDKMVGTETFFRFLYRLSRPEIRWRFAELYKECA